MHRVRDHNTMVVLCPRSLGWPDLQQWLNGTPSSQALCPSSSMSLLFLSCLRHSSPVPCPPHCPPLPAPLDLGAGVFASLPSAIPALSSSKQRAAWLWSSSIWVQTAVIHSSAAGETHSLVRSSQPLRQVLESALCRLGPECRSAPPLP